MIADLPFASTSVRQQRVRFGRRFWQIYLLVLFFGLCLAGLAWRSAPGSISLAAAALALTLGAWVVRPIIALHLTVFFALMGDSVTISWFPFNKNLSSRESLLYVSDQLTFSPLELVLGFAMVACFIRYCLIDRRPFRRGSLFWPLMAFSVFMAGGLFYGIATGGNLRVALFEVRGMMCFPIVYVLACNVCEKPRHQRTLMYTVVAAVMAQSLLSLLYLNGLSAADRKDLEALGEHGSALGINVVVVLLLALLLLKTGSKRLRIFVGVTLVPGLWVYFVSQRRAAFVALGVAMLMLMIVVFWRQRHVFWRAAPPMIAILTVYVGAFWNNTSSAGFPAQAVKAVIAPSSVSQADASSDLYRLIENYDLHVTVRSAPVLGLGFGQKFLRPVGLPDISFFEFYEYLPHNSFIWIWIKMGFAGFVAMIYYIARTVLAGVRKIRTLPDGTDLAVATTALLFVVMYSIYSYVDIGWDSRNMVLLGLCVAICSTMHPRAATPPPEPDTEADAATAPPFTGPYLVASDRGAH